MYLSVPTAKNSDISQCCGPSTNAMYSPTKLSISCETAVDPVARSHAWRSPVRRRIRWSTLTSISWPSMKATSDPQIVHSPCPNTARSEETTSEQQSLMLITYATFCLKHHKDRTTI